MLKNFSQAENHIKISFPSEKHKHFWNIMNRFHERGLVVFPDNVKKSKNSLSFEGKQFRSLSNFLKSNKQRLSYEMCLDFFENIGKIFSALEKLNLTVPFFAIDDFIVIDERSFLFINIDKIVTIQKSDQIIIDRPYPTNTPFFSPELKNITQLPAQIHCRSGLFSLAYLTAFLLTNENLTKKTLDKGLYWNQMDEKCGDPNEVSCEILLLETIFYTKLYWALKRCLQKNPLQRYFLII